MTVFRPEHTNTLLELFFLYFLLIFKYFPNEQKKKINIFPERSFWPGKTFYIHGNKQLFSRNYFWSFLEITHFIPNSPFLWFLQNKAEWKEQSRASVARQVSQSPGPHWEACSILQKEWGIWCQEAWVWLSVLSLSHPGALLKSPPTTHTSFYLWNGEVMCTSQCFWELTWNMPKFLHTCQMLLPLLWGSTYQDSQPEKILGFIDRGLIIENSVWVDFASINSRSKRVGAAI